MIPTSRFVSVIVIILSFAVFGEPWSEGISRCAAGDWPQILGPNRDSQALGEVPLKTVWVEDQPLVLWSEPIGSGYAGAAISGGVVYLTDRSGTQERLKAVDLQTGKSNWQASWPATYRSSMDPDSGPRAVPVIARGKAVCYGAAGDLVCVDTATGKVLWNQALRKLFKAEDGYFGAGCSPIVIGDTVIVNVGGEKAGIVGVSLTSGKVIWQSTKYEASYASPIAVQVAGKPAAIVVTRLKTVLVDAASGKVLSEIDFGGRGPTVNAATPLPLGNNQFFFTASYSIGAKLVDLIDFQLNVSFSDKAWLASQYNSPVKMGSVVVGSNGREDMGDVTARLLDPASKEVLHDLPLPGTTHMIAVGPQLLMLSVDGTLQLARVYNNRIDVMSKYSVQQASPAAYRALPAFSNHVLVVRSSQEGHGGQITAIKLP